MLTPRRQATALLMAVLTVAPGCASDTAGTTAPSSSELAGAAPASTAAPTMTTATSTTVGSDEATSTTAAASPTTVATSPATSPAASSTAYVVPIADVAAAGWGTTHSGYPATDIFAACGAGIVSPVDGVVLQVRTVDRWDPAVDDPATRGGRSVAVLGDDGVRYYLAHFDTIEPTVVEGGRVSAGDPVGTVGTTGRSSACHVHFSISPPCPGPEWSVRRGVIWPYPYLDAWEVGDQISPVDEIERWVAGHPDACADAMADPFAADAASP
ncbi:MAG: peptidoglycan DD-metalloendopeptidase family protein [Ilumatobacteraceae bacterium]